MRRAFTAGTSPAYDYDPYGTQIQAGAPVTDFTYAGLMALPEAGIYLSQTRPYNPGVGRWLRRDMAGESADADGNLYGYANRNPVNLVDPDGRNPLLLLMLRGAAIGALGDGLASLLKQMAHNGGKISCTNWDTVATDAALGGVKGALGVFRGAGTILSFVNRAERVNDVLEEVSSASGVFNPRFWTDTSTFEGNKLFPRNDLFDPDAISSWKVRGKIITGTNVERMASGRSPVGFDNEAVNLHHLIQTQDGAIAEVSGSMHRKYYSTLHINTGQLPSGINRKDFDAYRSRYWKKRAEGF